MIFYDKQGRAVYAIKQPDGSLTYIPKDEMLDINIAPFGFDTGIPYPETAAATMINAGDTFNKAGYAISESLGLNDAEDVARFNEEQRFLKPLQEDYPVASFAGQVLPSVPTMAFGGYPAAIGLGGATGYLDYEPGTNAAYRTGMGSVMGFGGQIAGELISRFANGVKMAFSSDDLPTTAASRFIENKGYPVTPGQRFDNESLKQVEAGMQKNFMMSGYFNDVGRQQGNMLALDTAKAIGVGEGLLEAYNYKITPEIIDAASDNLEVYFQNLGENIPRVELSPQLSKMLENSPDFKSMQKYGFFKNIKQGASKADDTLGLPASNASYITGQEYKQLRQVLAEDAANWAAKGKGSIAGAIFDQVNKLDDAIDQYVPPEFLEEYAKKREQYRVLQILQTQNKLKADGTINLKSFSNAINREFGKNASRMKTSKMQPETADLFQTLRTLKDPDIMPIVGDSGTGGANIMQENALNLIDAASGNNNDGLQKLIGQKILGKAYAEVAEKAPNFIGGMLDEPGELSKYIKRAAARASAQAANDE